MGKSNSDLWETSTLYTTEQCKQCKRLSVCEWKCNKKREVIFNWARKRLKESLSLNKTIIIQIWQIYSSSLCNTKRDHKNSNLPSTCDVWPPQTRQLVTVCDCKLLASAVQALGAARPDYVASKSSPSSDSEQVILRNDQDTLLATWSGSRSRSSLQHELHEQWVGEH